MQRSGAKKLLLTVIENKIYGENFGLFYDQATHKWTTRPNREIHRLPNQSATACIMKANVQAVLFEWTQTGESFSAGWMNETREAAKAEFDLD